MYGFVARDDQRTNIRTNNLAAGVVRASNYVVTLPYNPTTGNVDAAYELVPSGSKTIYQFSNPLGLSLVPTSPVITITVDSSQVQVGDEIAVIIKTVTNATPNWMARVVFAPENDLASPWYVTSCGGVHHGYAVAPTSGQRWIQVFMYDGALWTNTLDNC
jgi:hypothetical protein